MSPDISATSPKRRRNVSRNVVTTTTSDFYDDGYLRIEYGNYYIACNGTSVSLPRKEFLLLSRMARNVNRIVSAQDLWSYAWKGKYAARFNAESLHVHIYRLRRRLEAYNLQIETMVGVGYKLKIGDK